MHDEISLMSDGSAFQVYIWPGNVKGFVKAEYKRQLTFHAHLTEGGCRYNARRVLTDTVDQQHD